MNLKYILPCEGHMENTVGYLSDWRRNEVIYILSWPPHNTQDGSKSSFPGEMTQACLSCSLKHARFCSLSTCKKVN